MIILLMMMFIMMMIIIYGVYNKWKDTGQWKQHKDWSNPWVSQGVTQETK